MNKFLLLLLLIIYPLNSLWSDSLSVSSLDSRYYLVQKYCAETRSCYFHRDNTMSVNGFGPLIFFNVDGYNDWRNQQALQLFASAVQQMTAIQIPRTSQAINSPLLPPDISSGRGGGFISGGYEYRFNNITLDFTLRGGNGGVVSGSSFSDVFEKIDDMFNPGGGPTKELDAYNSSYRSRKIKVDERLSSLDEKRVEAEKNLEQETLKALNNQIEKYREEIKKNQKSIDEARASINEKNQATINSLNGIKENFKDIEEREKIKDFKYDRASNDLSNNINNDLIKEIKDDDALSILESDRIIQENNPYKVTFRSQGIPRQQLVSIYNGLNKTRPMSIQGKQAKMMGYVAVEESDNSYANGDSENGDVYKEYAQKFLDFASAFTPIGIGKDIIEGVSGRNLIDGRQLTTIERGTVLVAASVGVGFSLATAGAFGGAAEVATKACLRGLGNIGEVMLRKGAEVSGTLFRESIALGNTLLESAAKLGVKTPEGTKVYAKIHEAVEALPSNLKVQRIREAADPNKVAVIGRSMGDPKRGLVGVNDVAKHFSKKSIKVEAFNDASAWDKFKDTVKEYRAKVGDETAMLPNNEVMKTDLYKANKQWAQKLKDDGYTILDMGDPNEISEFSAFYAIEKKIFFHSGD